MPPHPYICTVTAPVRGNKGYLPPDGVCDYLFFDSLYKSFRSSLLDGLDMLDVGAQYLVYQTERYKFTHFGLSFSPEHDIFTDYEEQGFLNTIKEIWDKEVHHFGFLDLYRHLTHPSIVAQALTILKALYKFLAPNFSFKRSSYYVIGMTPDSTANDQIINLMKATPRTAPPSAPAREWIATDSVRVDNRVTSSRKSLERANCHYSHDFKIVIRPRGGLDVATTGTVRLTSAIHRAANVPSHEAGEDTVCSNNRRNIVVSTPHASHADKYRHLQAITIGDRHHEVSAYETAPDNTVKGIIKGIPLEEDQFHSYLHRSRT
ncbi:hypothetical protein HPB51_008670 [Rhipicephalus microplus]|uniref:Uncharacterized protein n=1 Tax=Rhipicephalus microplus TaxID=6941 RepID=A0A9J6E849_RHIMP|nr:hypothetical protein HPB51_008670 [Rhipicephalus microplus]